METTSGGRVGERERGRVGKRERAREGASNNLLPLPDNFGNIIT